MKLSGLVLTRNCIELDYCFEETIESLLKCCDIVTVCDGESADGTLEKVKQWMRYDPRIKLCTYTWPNPVGDVDFYVKWINYAREHVDADFLCHVESDEVINDYSAAFLNVFKGNTNPHERVSLWCHRYNFWANAHSLIPHGVCCGHKVVRVAPVDVWLPSDGPHPDGATAVQMAVESPVEIFHYGFLRKRDAFFKKAKELQNMFFGSYDPRLAAVERQQILNAEQNTGAWMEDIKGIDWIHNLVDFTGRHPSVIHNWLKERNYVHV